MIGCIANMSYVCVKAIYKTMHQLLINSFT